MVGSCLAVKEIFRTRGSSSHAVTTPGASVVGTTLDVEAVRRRAGVTAVAELGDHAAGDGGVEVCVLGDDEWRVAAQLHRGVHHTVGGLAQQHLADAVGAATPTSSMSSPPGSVRRSRHSPSGQPTG